ncbi:MAG: hypothetical protein KAI66_05105 [Lentisphaeria bacterium]|nr:hypothetical protein [Lentisphaeria bacterium]
MMTGWLACLAAVLATGCMSHSLPVVMLPAPLSEALEAEPAAALSEGRSPKHDIPSMGEMRDGAQNAKKAASARPHVRSIALVAVDGVPSRGISTLASVIDTAHALDPDCLILLGAAATSSTELLLEGKGTGLSRTLFTQRTVAFPGGRPEKPRTHAMLEGKNGTCLFVNASVLKNYPPAALSWLRARLTPSRKDGLLVLVTNEPLSAFSRSPGWLSIRQDLQRIPSRVVVVTGGTRHHSSWKDGSIEFFSLAPIGVGNREGVPADGAIEAFLWINLGDWGPTLRLVRPEMLSDVDWYNRRDQEGRKELSRSLTCTPAAWTTPTTTVKCQNPTRFPLDFETRWQTSGAPVQVEPEIVGFTLGPGESFQQEFALRMSDDTPLKFSRPQIVLATTLPDGDGGGIPVVLRRKIDCLMGGVIQHVTTRQMLGKPGRQWSVPLLSLSHPTQVSEGAGNWSGASDASAEIRLAHDGANLHVAIEVQDDKVARGDAVTVFADCSTGISARRLLVACVEATGKITCTLGGSTVTLPAKAEVTDQGYSVTLLVPGAVFPGGMLPDKVRIDIGLADLDSGGAATKLFFSGNGQDGDTSRLYGVFELAPATDGGGDGPPE